MNKLRDDIDVVSIYFWGRSGSFFVGSLLDSHKNVLTIPGGALAYFYQKGNFWDTSEMLELDIHLKIELFIHMHPHIFDGRMDTTKSNFDAMGDEQQEHIAVDKELFTKHMLEYAADNDLSQRRMFFIAIHFAYEKALGRDISEKYIINYQFHTPDRGRTNNFLQDFPEAKFLGTYREPERAFYSHLRMYKDNKNVWAASGPKQFDELEAVFDGKYAFYYWHQLEGWKILKHDLNLNLLPVRLEDLHSAPEETVRTIAEFVGIEFTPSMMESTFNGLKYWGDKRAVGKINGFDTKHTSNSSWDIVLSNQDRKIMRSLVSRHAEYKDHIKNEIENDTLLSLMILLPSKAELNGLLRVITVPRKQSKSGKSRVSRLFFLAQSYKRRIVNSLNFLHKQQRYY